MNKYIADNYNSLEAVRNYQAGFLGLRSLYLETPHTISIETYAKCDAACNFCPYVDIQRIGQRMPDDLLAKIVSDVSDLDQSVPLTITLARINEPFLDKRIFDLASAIHKVAPQASFIYFSNGSPLIDKVLDRLEAAPATFCLSLSMNDHRKQHYERIMRLPYERALQRFDAIHARKARGGLRFWTRVSKVADNTNEDVEFIAWARERWPLFDVAVYRRANWSGQVATIPSPVPEVGCFQWFTMGFYADGTDPFCVMDAEGRFRHGDIRKQHLLEIYNHPDRRKLRELVTNRKDVDYCRECPLMS
jgi:Iron-sulfur cluster-binding domain